MPRKVFVAGEILTAADVNTNLMDQSVMVFDDATARATAIPTPVEGMVTYLKDTDRVDKFDGTNFVNVDTGGLVAVKSAIRDTPFTASVASGANVAVDDLSITHEVADSANKLIISAVCGQVGTAGGQRTVGLAVHDGTGLLAVGTSVGSRVAVSTGGRGGPNANDRYTGSPSTTFVHTPGAGSKTYTVRVINIEGTTRTLFVNRSQLDLDDVNSSRSISSLVIQEVAV